MKRTLPQQSGYLISALLGAVGGGIFVMIATRAIPTMMAGMMKNMMSQMRASGCNPQEM